MKPNSSVRETHCDYTLTVNIRYTEHKKDKCGYPESDIFKNNKVLFENKISFEYAVDIITKQHIYANLPLRVSDVSNSREKNWKFVL